MPPTSNSSAKVPGFYVEGMRGYHRYVVASGCIASRGTRIIVCSMWLSFKVSMNSHIRCSRTTTTTTVVPTWDSRVRSIG